MTDSTRWKATVYVGGLGPQVTEANLLDAFIPFGDIADVTLPKNERRNNKTRETIDWANELIGATGTNGATNGTGAANGGGGVADDAAEGGDGAFSSGHRGFAYVEFEDADDAKEAIDNMDKSEFFGRIIKVTAAKAPKNTNEGLGSRTALWHQEAWLAQEAGEDVDPGQQAANGNGSSGAPPADPMQGLEDLDVAGPRPA